MAGMLGRRVWRGQTVVAAPLPRKHWRAREKRAWRREVRGSLLVDHRPPPWAGCPCPRRGEGR